jgi:hypothetical protein
VIPVLPAQRENYDGAFRRAKKLFVCGTDAAQTPEHVEAPGHHREWLRVPPLPGTQVPDRTGVPRIAGQVKPADPLHRNHGTLAQRRNRLRERIAGYPLA